MIDYKRIGTLRTRRASEVDCSRLGIGLEKLDRELYDPEKVYDRIAELGVKWVRIQSGWALTERSEGVYDFHWLDNIVDSLRSRGLVPWICVCYGNPVYTPMAAEVFGAVGVPPISTEREKTGWRNYVMALAEHMGKRVELYEVWNEPDGQWCWKTGVNASEYGSFVGATSRAIREANPNAKVIGGAVCSADLKFLRQAFDSGMAGAIDGLSFHRYRADEDGARVEIRALRALLDLYDPNLMLIQGESGGQSSRSGAGAMAGGAWDELKQAKHLLRQRITDLSEHLRFTSHFTSVDMAEALNGRVSEAQSYKDYGFFGVLSADFDDSGRSTGEYAPKPAFYALQNLAALLGDAIVKPADAPMLQTVKPSPLLLGDDCREPITMLAFRRGERVAMLYWKPCRLLSETYEGTVSFNCANFHGKPTLVNLLDGALYELPDGVNRLDSRGDGVIQNLPLSDTPMALIEEGFLE